jgi:putative membrane protein
MQLHWHTEPLLLITLLAVGWLYALGTGPFRKRIAPGAAFPTGRVILFYSGLIITYLAVGSPLDQIGEQFLFSAHMIQHMLLIYFSPTLFILGTPTWLIDWLLKPQWLRQSMRILTFPVSGGLLFIFIFTVWHVPALYEAALHDKRIHVLEHWTIFLPSILMLWPYLTTSNHAPRSSYGIRMLAIFLLMVGQLPVFAFLSFAGEPLYPTYAWAPRIIDLDPLNDQILGGIIMKIVNMIFSLTILGVTFYFWARSEEQDDSVAAVNPSSHIKTATS